MQWDMKPTEKIPELSLTLHSRPFFGDGFYKWGDEYVLQQLFVLRGYVAQSRESR